MNKAVAFIVPAFAVILSFLLPPRPVLSSPWYALAIVVYIALVGWVGEIVCTNLIDGNGKIVLVTSAYVISVMLVTLFLKFAWLV